jgi:hypothetical protein
MISALSGARVGGKPPRRSMSLARAWGCHCFAAPGFVAVKDNDGLIASYSERQKSLLSRRRMARSAEDS